MAKTQQEKEEFLRSTEVKVILIEVSYHDGVSVQTDYLGSSVYWSLPTDLVHQTYDDAILELPQIIDRIDDDASYGKLVIAYHPDYANWLDYSFDGWPMRLFIGGKNWSRDDFFEIFSGISAGIQSPNSSKLEIVFFDKREKLRVDFQQSNFFDDGAPYPVCIGPVFNATPRLVDKATFKYRFHENGNLSVANVRDHGVDLGVNFTDNADGTFTLDNAPTDPNGANITFDVTTGETDGTFSEIVKFLVLRSDLTLADIDTDNFDAFASTAVLARYVDQKVSIQSLIKEAETSVNAKARFNLTGEMELVKRYEIPGTQVIDFDEDDVIGQSLKLKSTLRPLPQVQMSYERNETVQDLESLAGSVSEADRSVFTSPYKLVTKTNAGVAAQFPNTEPNLLIETWHVDEVDAQSECDHLAAFYAQKRKIFTADFISSPYLLSVGDGASLTHSKFDFSLGKNIQIQGLKLRLKSRRPEVEFIL